MDIAREWRRLVLSEHAQPTAAEGALLQAADAVIRIAVADDEGNDAIVEDGTVSALLPEAAHEALIARNGVLLSATPMLVALPGFALKEAAVRDGAKVTRKMLLVSGRGSSALLKGPEGIPWRSVHAALSRAHAETGPYACKRVLFVTFKTLADDMRASNMAAQYGEFSVAHFGALRGKNDWMEGRPEECSVVCLFGTPRFAIMSTLRRLGLVGEAADQAWVAFAAAELTQAEGRLRLPRRTKPCTVIVEGDVAPSSWHDRNVDEIIELD